MSPWARKGPTGDCLMIVGSCIKYTAAAGKIGERLGSGVGGSPSAQAQVLSVRKTQSVWVPWLREGLRSKLINIFMTDLRTSAFF